MAKQTRRRLKSKQTRDGLPICYETENVRVYTNSGGEIVVENIRSGVKMRVFNPSNDGNLEFITEEFGRVRVEPFQFADAIGWRLSAR